MLEVLGGRIAFHLQKARIARMFKQHLISTFPQPGRRRRINPNLADQVLQKPDILIC